MIINYQILKKEGVMFVRVNRDNFKKVLKKVEGVTDKKATMAILSMVLVNPMVEANLIELTATDLEMGYRVQVPVEIEGEGAPFCVPAKKFYEIIKNFPEDELLLKLEKSRLIIRDAEERITYSLAITNSEEFPSLPEFIEKQGINILGSVLSELINGTIFCTSKDEPRFVLNGIFFEPLKEESKLRAVASDGHRLVYLEREVEGLGEVDLGDGFIIARKAARQMEAIANEESVVRLAFVNNHVVLRTPNSVFFSRTIEGAFPDYRSVIPTSNKNILRVDRKLFIDALKRVSLVATEKFKPVTITLKEGEIILTSQETEMGRAETKLSAEYEGEPLSVNYNAQYLLDALEAMKSEEIEMKIGEEKTPAMITGYRDEGFLYLVMPMVF